MGTNVADTPDTPMAAGQGKAGDHPDTAAVWYGMLWYGMVWYVMAWYGMV